MSWIQDLDPFGYKMLAVGWLHPDHPFPSGSAPREFVSRLRQFQELAPACARAFHLSAGLGFHICEFCFSETAPPPWPPEAMGHGYICAIHGDRVFVAPQMLPHYIEKHGYLPPAEFITAVSESPLPGTVAYQAAADRFTSVIYPPRDLTKPPLLEKIAFDLKSAMKARDSLRVSTLRLAISEITNRHIQVGLGSRLTDEVVLQVLKNQVALHREAMDEFQAHGRQDLADKERGESQILEEYLG